MKRATRIAAWTLGGLATLLVLLALGVAFFPWNRLKPMVEDRASSALQRPVAIQGDLDVDWQWRDGILPWPQITVNQVAVGHPDGFEGGEEGMGHLEWLSFSINPLPLFARHVEIPRLEIGDSRVVLQRNVGGENNWVYERKQDQNEKDSGWTWDLHAVALQRVELQVIDKDRNLDMRTRFNSLDTADGAYGMDWESTGTFNDAEVTGGGKMGSLLSLRERSDPFPLQGEVSFGETRLAVEGSMTAPRGLASVDVRLKLAGSSLSDMNALFGLALPTTPPYATEGRLLGHLDSDEDTWRYEDFSGKVGESDLRGTVEYRIREPRPLLTGSLASDVLRFRDLGPLIGVDSSDVEEPEARRENERDERKEDESDQPKEDESRQRKEAEPDEPEEERKQPPGKVLPVARIGSDTWDLMDADVRFVGRRIIQNENLPLDNLDAHVKLQDKVLSFEPLNFGVAGGTLSNTIRIDGRKDVLQADMVSAARGLQLKQLFPGASEMQASFGKVHGDARLKGQGDSIAALLGGSNGEVSLALSRGTISRFLIEAAGLNVANAIFLKLFGDEQIMLECMLADFGVRDGLMQTRTFVIETEDAVITMDGNVSLKEETLDLDIRPKNKTLRIFTLRSPLYAKGTFKDPDVGVQAVPVAARAGAAVALGVVAAPLAALLPLLNPGTGDDVQCSSVPGTGGNEARGQAGGSAQDSGGRGAQSSGGASEAPTMEHPLDEGAVPH